MSYEVLVDGATILKALSSETLPDGTVVYDHVSTVFPAGAIIADEDVSPVVVKLLEDGDEHTNKMLKETGDEPTHLTSERTMVTEEQADHDPRVVEERVAAGRSELISQQTGELPETGEPVPAADEAAPEEDEEKPKRTTRAAK